MLFDEKYYYCFIDDTEFDSKVLFSINNGFDKCKRKIITYYKNEENIGKQIKSADNYLYEENFNDKNIITKYYIETFNLNNFEFANKIYVRIFGLGCYFKYLKNEVLDEYKDDEEEVKTKFNNYDKNYLKLNDEDFLKGVE